MQNKEFSSACTAHPRAHLQSILQNPQPVSSAYTSGVPHSVLHILYTGCVIYLVFNENVKMGKHIQNNGPNTVLLTPGNSDIVYFTFEFHQLSRMKLYCWQIQLTAHSSFFDMLSNILFLESPWCWKLTLPAFGRFPLEPVQPSFWTDKVPKAGRAYNSSRNELQKNRGKEGGEVRREVGITVGSACKVHENRKPFTLFG